MSARTPPPPAPDVYVYVIEFDWQSRQDYGNGRRGWANTDFDRIAR